MNTSTVEMDMPLNDEISQSHRGLEGKGNFRGAFVAEPGLRQAPPFQRILPLHANHICRSLRLDAAGRAIVDIASDLKFLSKSVPHTRSNIFILHNAPHEFELEGDAALKLHRLHHLSGEKPFLHIRALLKHEKDRPVFAHGLLLEELQQCWQAGLPAIPVYHDHALLKETDLSQFKADLVPAIVVTTEEMRRYVTGRCQAVTHLIRHERNLEVSYPEAEFRRNEIRSRYEIDPSVALIGMIGKVRPEKNYLQAIEVLKRVRKEVNACLLIVGPWDPPSGRYGSEAIALQRKIHQAGLQKHVIFAGPRQDAMSYYPAFDAFMALGDYGAINVSTSEARIFGTPIVATHMSPRRERISEGEYVLRAHSSAESIALTVCAALRGNRRPLKNYLPYSGLMCMRYEWLRDHGIARASDLNRTAALFITNNLNQGGAQRSLINLAISLGDPKQLAVAILNPSMCDEHIEALHNTGIEAFTVKGTSGDVERISLILQLVESRNIKTLCFWNLDARVKGLLTNVLDKRKLRIIDVSPGPQLYSSLERAEAFLRRLDMSRSQYLSRLDVFVSKYNSGLPPPELGTPGLLRVIPNGVAAHGDDLLSTELMLRPKQVDPELAVVSCCRIVPAKLVDQQLKVAKRLSELVPGASLTIVGRIESGAEHQEYGKMVRELHSTCRLQETVFFIGPNSRAPHFLREFKAFLMLSHFQGCPNASLEAMSNGLPVVANPDGGTAEQVVDNQTGFLVSEWDIETIAQRLAYLLRNPTVAAEMGKKGAARARSEFSLEKMAQAYRSILFVSDNGNGHD